MFLWERFCEQVSSRSTFPRNPLDAEILKDTSNYREVGDIMGARALIFITIGGYSCATKGMQQLLITKL
jgi:hypothetical protein